MNMVVNRNYNKKMLKKGQQSASAAAALVAIIGIVFLLYILFLPPDTRESLLNPDNESSNPYDTSNNGDIISTLLDKSPGKIDYIPDKSYRHAIPASNLKKTTSSEQIAEEKAFIVKKTWFSGQEKLIEFMVPNLEDTNNLMMTFNAIKRRGILTIYLNNINIYSKELTDSLVEPIELKKNYLNEDENVLKFVVSSPEWKFWDHNIYSIENLIIAGDISDSRNLESTHKFFMTAEEVNNIDEAKMIFTPFCNQDYVGRLTIRINDNNIYSAIPDCNYKTLVHLSTEIFETDDNIISFETNYGEYTLDLITVETEINNVNYPTYYFDLSQSQVNNLRNFDDKLNITVVMLDDDEFKDVTIYVNDLERHIDSKDSTYITTINNPEHLYEGSNVIKLKPSRTMDFVRLKVQLID